MTTRTAPHMSRRSNRLQGHGYTGRHYTAAHRLCGQHRPTYGVYAPYTLVPVGLVRATGAQWPARPWAARAVAGSCGTTYHRTLRQALRHVAAQALCTCGTRVAYAHQDTCPALPVWARATPAQVAHRAAVAAVPHMGHELPASMCLADTLLSGVVPTCGACLASPVWQEWCALHEHAARVGMAHHDRRASGALPTAYAARRHLALAGVRP